MESSLTLYELVIEILFEQVERFVQEAVELIEGIRRKEVEQVDLSEETLEAFNRLAMCMSSRSLP